MISATFKFNSTSRDSYESSRSIFTCGRQLWQFELLLFQVLGKLVCDYFTGTLRRRVLHYVYNDVLRVFFLGILYGGLYL